MRLEQITFTRFIAAIAIVFYHFGREIYPFNIDEVREVLLQANIGVSYFFILSGFIMIISYGGKQPINWLDYIKNRIARVYPLYLLGILAMIIVPLLALDVNLYELFFATSMIQAWIPGKAMSYNFPGWSISVEFFFYALFPFLLNRIYSKEYKLRTLAFFGIAIWILTQLIFHYLVSSSFYKGDPSPSHDLLYFFPAMHLSEFLIGNLAGLFFIKIKDVYQKKYDLAIVLLFILLIIMMKFPMGLHFHNGLLAVLFVPIILLLSLNTGFITKLFSKKPFVFLGEVSYSIYILQLPVFYYTKKIQVGSPETTFYLKVLFHIALCCLTYLYIEKPLRSTIKNIRFSKLKAKV
jgi:peptidoglycan/LPS O-acetylase OafA/YrhL